VDTNDLYSVLKGYSSIMPVPSKKITIVKMLNIRQATTKIIPPNTGISSKFFECFAKRYEL
jgi:hypothetical protein